MNSKILLMTATLMLAVAGVKAQTLSSAYFTDDFKYRHTMNPAYDNAQSYVALPGLGNLNIGVQGNFGYDAIVMANPLAGQAGQKSMTTFLNPYIDASKALDGFNSSSNRIVGNVGVTLLSAGFKAFGGYNTVELNAKASFGMSLPYELFEFAKNTGNSTYDIGDISAGAISYIELALGHSHQVNKQLRLGGKLKVLMGAGRADVKLEDMKADLSQADQWTVSGKATADVSMKGFQYKEKTKEYKQKSGSYRYVNDVDVDGGGLSGMGLAVDLGAVYQINEDWKVSAALLDLGFISWSNDWLARNMTEKAYFNGFHDIDVYADKPFKEQGDSYLDQLADFANLQSQGDQGGRTTGIGATVNAGVEYTLPVYRKMTFGLLGTSRFCGDFSWTEARLSANWKPLSWLDGGMTAALGSLTSSIGCVVNIHPKGFNFFIGTDHIIGKMSKEGIPLSSCGSVSVGMNIAW